MVLNALNIDPGRAWKGPWRWFSEQMLECCVPLDVIEARGVSLDDFARLARCHGAAATLVRASTEEEENKNGRGVEGKDEIAFRNAVKESSCVKGGNLFIIASYSRTALGQTGEGHFSPIAGYDAKTDSVLILDVARFKYPPHWVSLPKLVKAMRSRDRSTDAARGWVVLERTAAVPLLLFAFGSGAGAGAWPWAKENEKAMNTEICGLKEACCRAGLPAVGAGTTCCRRHGRSMGAVESMLVIARSALDGARVDSLAEAISLATQALLPPLAPLVSPATAGIPIPIPIPPIPNAAGTYISDDARCWTRLSREQILPAAALISALAQTELHAALHSALVDREAVIAVGTAAVEGEGLVVDDDDMPTTVFTPPPHVHVHSATCVTHKATGEICVRVSTTDIIALLLMAAYCDHNSFSGSGNGGGGGGNGGSGSGGCGGSDSDKRFNAAGFIADAVKDSLKNATPGLREEIGRLRSQLTIHTSECKTSSCKWKGLCR